MTEDENIRNGQQISKHLFLILFIGLIPFIAIFILLTLNPYMKIFIAIADLTRDWPGMTSAHNPLMSKIMDVYLKSFPAFLFILRFHNI
ncbi:colicin immunity protein Cui [Erwinia aphidicola]|uniref:colicin immunity protein Cui n=1 Tax=Erwinia aphidicola TaxID=68334 RepID=UPI0030CBC26E